ncbi:heterokaryon incompatibility protein-domain-containing protein [Xylariaceae sp. FL1019]|nr:heterokaryon incompatibility protein-domain-containing protein [Xylariaceae sp. FL1019]
MHPTLSQKNPLYGEQVPLRARTGYIRLITVEHGTFDATITCHLGCVALDSNPSYLALSYAWGVSRASRPIVVNGLPIYIRSNLDRALRHVRKKDADIDLWVDAICIDQDDAYERSQQVGMMREIFGQASLVLVFLGDERHQRDPCPTTSKRAIGRQELESNAEEVFSLLRALDPNDCGGLTHFVESVGQRQTSRIIEAVRLMLMSAWWLRMWVYQEVIVSRKLLVYYGSSSISWSTLLTTSQWRSKYIGQELPIQDDDAKVLDRLARQVGDIEERRRAWSTQAMLAKHTTPEQSARTLLAMLRETAHRRASDDRDKVYALFGLAADSLQLFPDYDVDVGTAYCQVARAIIHAQRGFDGLIHDIGSKTQPGVPTWVPDWSFPVDDRCSKRQSGAKLYNASGGWKYCCHPMSYSARFGDGIPDFPELHRLFDKFSSREQSFHKISMSLNSLCQPYLPEGVFDSSPYIFQPLQLWTEGIPIGNVDMVSRPFFGDVKPQDFFPFINESDWFLIREASPVAASDSNLLFRTSAGFIIPQLRALVFDLKFVSDSFQRLQEDDLGALLDWFIDCTQDTPRGNPEDPLGFTTVLKVMSYKQRLFTTTNGTQGWGPISIQQGDCIFIIPGSRVPLTLRKVEGSIEKYRVIGDCFLLGFMDGQHDVPNSPKDTEVPHVFEPASSHIRDVLGKAPLYLNYHMGLGPITRSRVDELLYDFDQNIGCKCCPRCPFRLSHGNNGSMCYHHDTPLSKYYDQARWIFRATSSSDANVVSRILHQYKYAKQLEINMGPRFGRPLCLV